MNPYYSSYFITLPSTSRLTSDLVAMPPVQALYDFSGLGKLSRDPSFVREMQQMFVERVPKQLTQLAANTEEEQWEAVARLAHSLKATFGNLRMEPSTNLLQDLEINACQQRNKQELKAILRAITTTAEVVVRIFRDELSRAA